MSQSAQSLNMFQLCPDLSAPSPSASAVHPATNALADFLIRRRLCRTHVRGALSVVCLYCDGAGSWHENGDTQT